VLIGPTPGIRRVLQIARLDSCLEIRERPEASTLPAGDLHPPLEADTDRSQLDARQAVPDAV
jgi:hypothetical protein